MYQFGDFRLKIILLGQKVLHQCCTRALKIRRYTARLNPQSIDNPRFLERAYGINNTTTKASASEGRGFESRRAYHEKS